MRFGDFTDFEERSRSEMLRAVVAIVFIFIGFVLMVVAARGVAGTGVILDPKRAREDLEPWARMSGGLLKDALDEANVLQGDPADENTREDFDETLRKLHQLHEDGIISTAEYERKKAEVLDRA